MLSNLLKYSIVFFLFNVCIPYMYNNKILNQINESNIDNNIIESVIFSFILILLIKTKNLEGMKNYHKNKKY